MTLHASGITLGGTDLHRVKRFYSGGLGWNGPGPPGAAVRLRGELLRRERVLLCCGPARLPMIDPTGRAPASGAPREAAVKTLIAFSAFLFLLTRLVAG